MNALIGEILAHTGLKDNLIEPTLDMLRQITASEKELIRLVVEIVQDLRDPEVDEDNAPDDVSFLCYKPVMHLCLLERWNEV